MTPKARRLEILARLPELERMLVVRIPSWLRDTLVREMDRLRWEYFSLERN